MHSDQVQFMGWDSILEHKVPMPFQFSKEICWFSCNFGEKLTKCEEV